MASIDMVDKLVCLKSYDTMTSAEKERAAVDFLHETAKDLDGGYSLFESGRSYCELYFSGVPFIRITLKENGVVIDMLYSYLSNTESAKAMLQYLTHAVAVKEAWELYIKGALGNH